MLKHLHAAQQVDEPHEKPKSLLNSDSISEEEAIWLIISTKKNIVTHKRLKPTKVLIPHSLNISPTLSICLLVPDPQKAFKDVVGNLKNTSQRLGNIDRIIDIKKLEKKYHSFESKRQLKNSHDLFFADDRIITYLPKIMGKTFFSSTTKRPVPVRLQPRKSKEEKGNSFLPIAKSKKNQAESVSMIDSAGFVQEIERTLRTTMVNLSPSPTTAVRVGLASFTPNQLAENIEAVIEAMVEKMIPKKWKGLKSIHLKGPNSMALPLWLAEEMWEDEIEVLEDSEIKQRRLDMFSKKRKSKMVDEQQEHNMKYLKDTQDIVQDESASTSKKRRVEIDQETGGQRAQLRHRRRGMREKLTS